MCLRGGHQHRDVGAGDATLTFAAGQVRTIAARDNVVAGAPLNAIVLNDLN